ncbi:hypothetical protein A2W24_06005 [Microgenomates group bacterium RBG_16_45_19]|nr:MAG: hypothetical protein A2W24_06005 [Microgenomates group bacterium RBG_16_45_19]
MVYSIIQKRKLEGALRLDAEYYCSPTSIKDFLTGEQVVSFIQYGTSNELNENRRGYPVLRLNEFDGMFVKHPEKYCEKINQKSFEELKLKKDDVLICRTNGNPKLVGKAALVMRDEDMAFASYLFRVRPKASLINSSTLAVFLNTNIGRQEIEKHMMTSNQTNFSPARFRAIKIPKIPPHIQITIEKLLSEAYNKTTASKTLYQQAENLLLEELGLKDFQPSQDLSYTVNFSDIQTANRLDADYFQPKYERLISKLKTKRASKLSEVITNVKSNFSPTDSSDVVFYYIELSNINPTIGIIEGFTKVTGREAPSRAKRLLEEGDVIVSSIEGSLDKVALVDKKHSGNLASTGFFQFRSPHLLPEVLLVLAKSIIFQMQLKQQCAGTILAAVPQETLEGLLLPTIPTNSQQQIADLVVKSHEARQKSKALLEQAKKMVEDMIETNGGQHGQSN